ncbi:MAG: hypothetical protein V3R83_12465 [Gammaproteobacteria bacterium]
MTTNFIVEKSRTGVQTKIFGLSYTEAQTAVRNYNTAMAAPERLMFRWKDGSGAMICRDGSVRVSAIFQGGDSTKKILALMGLKSTDRIPLKDQTIRLFE